ncbi:MAG: tetratricopeptide repeat protein [Candidatus Omnitrophica bacterium]|nr:tetratricopeptide repeat protein [Candidatus Omnitrophota bacterium]
MNKCVRNIQLILALLFLSTATCYAGIFSKTHTAALMLGEGRNEVLKQAEHVLGEPIKTDVMPADEENQFETRYYEFTDEEYIVLIFYGNRFFQLIVEKKDPDDLPFLTDMSYYLKGFVLAKKGEKIELKMLGSSNERPVSGMITRTSLDVAWAKLEEKNNSDARMIALNVIKQYPVNAQAYNLLGNVDLRENHLESSINYFQKALDIVNERKERKDYLLNNLAIAYLKGKQFDKAHDIFEESIEDANDLNCAGRIGNFLSLISLEEEEAAKRTIEPCEDFKQVKETLENMFDYFEIANAPLKEKAIKLLK